MSKRCLSVFIVIFAAGVAGGHSTSEAGELIEQPPLVDVFTDEPGYDGARSFFYNVFRIPSVNITDPAGLAIHVTAINSDAMHGPVTHYSGAVGEIRNSTGYDWYGLELRLITDATIEALDFDVDEWGQPSHPGVSTLGVLQPAVHEGHLLRWVFPPDSGSGPWHSLQFDLDIPNWAGADPLSGEWSFTLEFVPLIPEPATLGLFGAGVATVLLRRRRR